MKMTLKDLFRDNELEVTIKQEKFGINITPKGYGDYSANDGEGMPIFIEIVDGELRLVVWNDINKQDPLIISLEGAKESNRKELATE